MNTRVINIRKAPANWEHDEEFVYIGRAGRGHDGYFGNPVAQGRKCPECGEVHRNGAETIPCFTKYLARRLANDEEFRERVRCLKGKSLICFCKPNPCHGDVLKQFIDDLNEE